MLALQVKECVQYVRDGQPKECVHYVRARQPKEGCEWYSQRSSFILGCKMCRHLPLMCVTVDMLVLVLLSL